MRAEGTKMPEPVALKPCPFCGAPASGYAIEPHTHHVVFNGVKMPDHPGSYVIEGDCQCGSGLIGDTQEEVTARWNARHSPYTAEDLEQAKQEATRQAMERYNELLFAVGKKYPGQTRHETALMYIKRAEESTEVSALLPQSEKRHG